MRRLILCAVVALCAGCGSDSLSPVTSCEGQWRGTQNGYQLSLDLVQSGTGVNGTVQLAGPFGFADGTVSGSCSFPDVGLVLSVVSFEDVSYTGTLSKTTAKILGQLNGSGFVNLELDVSKR